jgi:hypothetical protein
MINNWKHFNLQPNFKNIKCANGSPSDTDMFYITKDKFLIIGEFKNGDMGTLKPKQKELFETFINNYKYGGIIIYAVHHKTIEEGATDYDASQCKVEEYYYKGKWYKPKKYTIVQDIFNKYESEDNMNIEDNRPKMVFKYITKDGKEFYSIGLSKKKQDGSYENGFINCRFKKDVKLENKTKILIKGGWLDFYLKDKITNPFIFINDFEIIQENKPVEVNEFSVMNTKTEYQNEDSDIKLDDKDLPW